MKKGKITFHLGVQWTMIAWALVYIGIIYLTRLGIEQDFGYLRKEDSVVQSIALYENNIIRVLGVTCLVSVIWWWMSLTKSRVRSKFEENTFLYAVAAILILAISIFFMNLAHSGITDDLGNHYTLYYVYCFIGGFIFNLFAFPPKNVQLVMFMGPVWVRYLVAAAGFLVIFFIV